MPFEITSVEKSSVSDSIIHTPITKLKNKKILEVTQKGKMLNFILDDSRHILSHLGMSGTWLISDKKITEKHTHFQLTGLSKGEPAFLAYVDPRRFGHMYLYDKEQAHIKLNELGADLKSEDFTFEYFKKAIQRFPQRMLKVTLLDQSLFAGSGNYIANEICARGKVRPDRIVTSLKPFEMKALYKAVGLVLDDTIESGGTTFAGGYRDTEGNKGGGVKHLVVFYQKTCQMCKKENIIKIILGQRGTYYCPRCQK